MIDQNENDVDLDMVDEFLSRDRKRQEHEQREVSLAFIRDVKNVLGTESGRRFVFWTMNLANMFNDGYNGRSLDMAYTMGRQSLCKEILRVALYADDKIFAKFVEDKLMRNEEI